MTIESWPKLWLQISDSNDFFQENIEFLQRIGFTSVLSIDMDIKYSFKKVNLQNSIQWAEISTFDNDHRVDDVFFAHKIIFPNTTHITRSLVYIKFMKKKSLNIRDVTSFIRAIPVVSLLFFVILSFFIPGFIWAVLKWCWLISLGIFCFYFIFRFLKYYFEITKYNSSSIGDNLLTYINPRDLELFTKEVRAKISEFPQYWITDMAIDRNTFYFKQDLIDESKSTLVNLLFGQRKTYSEEEKTRLMNLMMDVLSDPNFLDVFTKKEDDD